MHLGGAISLKSGLDTAFVHRFVIDILFVVAIQHVFAGKQITKFTRLFRGQTPMTHSAPLHQSATVNLAIKWLHLAALDTSM